MASLLLRVATVCLADATSPLSLGFWSLTGEQPWWDSSPQDPVPYWGDFPMISGAGVCSDGVQVVPSARISLLSITPHTVGAARDPPLRQTPLQSLRHRSPCPHGRGCHGVDTAVNGGFGVSESEILRLWRNKVLV